MTGQITVLAVDHEGSDWIGLYLDGERVYEGHPPDAEDAFRMVGLDVEVRVFPSADLADKRRMRGLPTRLPRQPRSAR